jgi:hypothetical protein
MDLDACFRVCGILHDTQEAFVRTFSNRDSLAYHPVPACSLWRWHGRCRAIRTIPLQRWVHLRQIRADVVDAPSLCCDRLHILACCDEKTRVLDLRSIQDEEEVSMHVHDVTLSLGTHPLLDDIIDADLGALAISGHSILPALQLVGDVRR